MFKPTKPFKDMVTNYPEEPSLRIGRVVPENAVNLAYYYNPTATDAEKILTAEAPRTTIDHRVEEAYRYLFDQASDDDDLFPGSVYFEDEEGYSGRLGRMWVNWYPEVHIETKNVTETKTIIVVDKSELPKMFEYSDAYGYSGNLYLDATSFEVYKWKTENTSVVVDRAVLDHEIIYKEVTGNYISPNNLDMWMVKPDIATGSMWPASITVNSDKLVAMGGTAIIKNYVNAMANPYDEAVGSLTFTDLEYEQVFKGDPKSGTISDPKQINTKFDSPQTYRFTETLPDYPGDTDGSQAEAGMAELKEKAKKFIKDAESDARSSMKSVFMAIYDRVSDTYDYSQINDFLNNIVPLAKNSGASGITKIRNAITAGNDIAIFMDRIDMKADDPDDLNTTFHFEAIYKFRISDRGEVGTYEYSVVATYKGVLKKTIITEKQVPAEYKVTCEYVGLVRHIWYDYDGQAYYRGAVTKGNAMGNVNPEGDDEILMFSDDEGFLRRPVEITMEDGTTEVHNFYRVEGDYFYITDVFKEGTACFFKYPLKRNIYDYRGPDENGFYEGNAVKMSTAAFKNLPKEYKYAVKLDPSEYELVDEITNDFQIRSVNKPKRYTAYLYTSFISGATDTFKATYNAFNDSDTDNVALDSGVTEDVFNYPFMFRNVDYTLVSVEPRARTNKIKLNEPRFIEDTRRWISFSFIIGAEVKPTFDSEGNMITPPKIYQTDKQFSVSILNKDYAVESEYSKFDGRAFIISTMSDNVYLSPMDMLLRDQANSGQPTVITSEEKDVIYRAEIIKCNAEDVGCINIKCNPDGSGLLTAETTLDTGFYNESTGEYNKKLIINNPYWIENGKIYPGFKVKAVDSRYIKVDAPREDGLLESWYPMIQFGHYSQVMDQYGTHVKVCYSMPEYDTQHFSPTYGPPYMDITEEKVKILNSHMVKTKCYPLHVYHVGDDIPTVKLFKRIDGESFPVHIKNISFKDGVIVTEDTISENDDIIATYTYVEENYIYRGYWRNEDDFARVDLNPNMYHTYSDLGYIPSETKPSKNLFNKVIYFFMKPSLIYEVSAENDRLIYDMDGEQVKQVQQPDGSWKLEPVNTEISNITEENGECLYHQIDDSQPQSDTDIYIGSVYIRQNTSLHSTVLVDSRTRGGGIITSMKESIRHALEPESDFYLDIGYYDGEPYQENGVIIVRLDQKILKEFGGRFTQGDVEVKVKRWLGFGVFPIIEYVDAYGQKDLPQYNLEVDDTYTNVTTETPELILECVRI